MEFCKGLSFEVISGGVWAVFEYLISEYTLQA